MTRWQSGGRLGGQEGARAKSQKFGRKVAESEGGWVKNADFPAGGRVVI